METFQMFTSILVEEALGICECKLREDCTLNAGTSMDVTTIVWLLRFCLTTTVFLFQSTHFQQLDSVAMGVPVFLVIADIFMEDLEERALVTFAERRLWGRFVDDVIAIVTKETGKKMLQHLHSQHPRIKFTLDEEERGCLPYMNVTCTCQLDGSLTRLVHQKPTHTNKYVLFSSHHPTQEKEGIVRGLADRAIQCAVMGRRWIVSSNVLRRLCKDIDFGNSLQRRRSAESYSDQW